MAALEARPYGGAVALGTVGSDIAVTQIEPLALDVLPTGVRSFEQMQQSACTHMQGVHLLEGAGHWVQQEKAEQVSELLLGFLESPTVRAQRS